MKKIITFWVIGILCLYVTDYQLFGQNEKSKKKVKIYVNEPVELLLTIYGLTPSAQEFVKDVKKDRDWVDAMIDPLMRPYQKYQNHEAVKAATQLYKEYGFWASQIVGEIATQSVSIPIDAHNFFPGEKSQYIQDVRRFIELANQFYVDTDFNAQFIKNKPIYDAISEEVRANMPSLDFFPMMENYYQKSFHSYHLCPSPLLPAGNGMGFGPQRKTKEGTLVFNVFSGIDQPNVDAKTIIKSGGIYGFNNEGWIRGISTHEFGHSFVNEPLYVYQDEFDKYSYLRKSIKKEMKNQGYWDWKTILAEHLVRVGEIRIAEKLGLSEVSNDLYKDYYIGRHFIYLPHFLKLIKQYEGNPKYDSFKAFIPVIVESLREIDAKKAIKEWKEAKGSSN